MENPLVISYLRFSRPEQLQGDSVRRQLELGERWAKDRGLVIADSFRDLGISAFRGANASDGNLSRLLRLVDEGKIPAGSVLLVEQLDRLSRNAVLEALELFLSIIRRGIKIVTLMDGQEYDQVSLSRNMMQLQYSIMMMSLAHEESAKKSERLGHAWKAKRDRIGQAVYTRLVPAWLRAEDDRIVIDEPKAAVVRRIVDLALDGHGLSVITKRLNADTPPISRDASCWNRSFVNKILHSRALVGEFEPHRLTYRNGRKGRESLGKVITGYYPRLIEDETFYALQAKMAGRRRKGGPCTKYVNLFNGVLFDAADGTAMALQDKGLGKRYSSMASILGKPGHSPYVGFPVAIFEQGFLLNFHDFVLPKIFQSEDGSASHAVDGIEAKLNAVDRKAEKLTNAMLAAGEEFDAGPFTRAMGDVARQRQALADQLEAAKRRQASEQLERRNTLDERLIRLVRVLQSGSETLTMDQRVQIREAIRSSVTRIDASFKRVRRNYHCVAAVRLRDGQSFSFHLFADHIDRADRNAKGHLIKRTGPTGPPEFKLGIGEPRWFAFGSVDGQRKLIAKLDEPISFIVPVTAKPAGPAIEQAAPSICSDGTRDTILLEVK